MNHTQTEIKAENDEGCLKYVRDSIPRLRNPDYTIVNIRRGKGSRSQWIYAELRDANTGELLIAATLDYIVERLEILLNPVH